MNIFEFKFRTGDMKRVGGMYPILEDGFLIIKDTNHSIIFMASKEDVQHVIKLPA